MTLQRRCLGCSLLLAAAAGCGSPERVPETAADSIAAAIAAAPAQQVDAGALRSLSWLEGRWRGEDPDGNPFYEAYRFENDSTLRSYTYADSAAVVPSDSGTIAQRGGEVTTGDATALWVASELREDRVAFAPRAGVQNSFVWQRVSPDEWTATLRWPAAAGQPAREVVYQMRRIP